MGREGSTKQEEIHLTVQFNFATKIFVHNLEVAALMGGDAENDGKTLAGGVASRLGFVEKKIAKKREREQRREFERILRYFVEKALHRLNEIIRYHFEQMERLLEQIAGDRERLEELDRQEQALKAVIAKYQQTGEIDLDKDGRLDNKHAEAAVREYEERTGKKVDRSDPAIYALLLGVLMNVQQGREQARFDIEENTKRYEHHKKQKEKAEAIKGELESGDPGRCQKAILEMENIGIDQRYDVVNQIAKETPEYEAHKLLTGPTELVDKETEGEEFSFGFPALRDNFSEANAGENKKEPLQPENRPLSQSIFTQKP